MIQKKLTNVNELSRTLQHAKDRETLLSYVGRDNITIVQDDIGLTYVWDDEIKLSDNNNGTILFVNNGGWRAVLDDHIDVRWFGAKGDGVTDDTDAIYRATTEANKLGLTPKFKDRARYLLTGDTDIEFTNDTDFNNSTFVIDKYLGKIKITDNVLSVNTYYSGDLFDRIVANDLSKNSNHLGDFVFGEITPLDDCFLRINTNKTLFRYRDEDIMYTELTRFLKYGRLEEKILTDINKEEIVSVTATKLNAFKELKNLNIELVDTESAYIFYIVNATNTTLKNIKIIRNNDIENENINLIDINESYNIKLSDIDMITNANLTNTYTYSINMSNSLNITIDNVNAVGDGWGSTGNNYSRNVLFTNSNISRVDFHKPFLDKLKIQNCTLGKYAVQCCGFGDLYIVDTDIIVDKGYSPKIFLSRGDCGGIIEGDLYVNNVNLYCEEFTDYDPGVLACTLYEDDNGAVENGVMSNRFFNNINLNNVKFKVGESDIVYLLKATYPDRIMMPNKISVNNVELMNDTDKFIIGNEKFIPTYIQDSTADSIDYKYSSILTLKNIATGNIIIGGSTREDYAISVVIDNIRTKCTIEQYAMGDLNIINCNKLVKIDAHRYYRIHVNINSNIFVADENNDKVIDIPYYNSRFVKINSNQFLNLTEEQFLNLLIFDMNNNMLLNSSTYFITKTITDTDNKLIIDNIMSGLPITVVTGVDDTIRYEYTTLPKKNRSITVGTATSLCRITRNDDDTLTVDSPDDQFVRIDTCLEH